MCVTWSDMVGNNTFSITILNVLAFVCLNYPHFCVLEKKKILNSLGLFNKTTLEFWGLRHKLKGNNKFMHICICSVICWTSLLNSSTIILRAFLLQNPLGKLH